MRFKQANPVKQSQKYRLYQQSALTNAYIEVKDNKSSVTGAARRYGVPEQTLRDRVKGKVDIDNVASGRSPCLDLDEEVKLVEHLKSVAKYGYGYTRQEVVDIASNYAFRLGKRRLDKPFTLNWFVHFIRRWPELRVLKPRSLEIQRAKNTSSTVVTSYFEELEEILVKYDLKDKPHLIYNVDEKGISQNHSPPYVVGTTSYHPQAVTAGKTQTTTILGCGSAAGVAIPPFFVFAGKRLIPELMKGATPGAAGAMSESGWSNSNIFHQYLTEHFIKFIPQRQPGQHLLLILDGHKSHVSVELVEWAKSQNIVLFILPAHTSHVLQPMDVACFGPFQNIYNNLCHKLNRESTSTVTRHDVCRLGCQAYSKALSLENLHSAFKKCGIYPLNKDAISDEAVTPAELFNQNLENAAESSNNPENDAEPSNHPENVAELSNNPVSNIENNLNEASDNMASPSNFMTEKLKTLQSIKKQSPKKPRKTLSKIVSGKAVTEKCIEEKIIAHVSTQNKRVPSNKRKSDIDTNKQKHKGKGKKQKCINQTDSVDSPQPGPSKPHDFTTPQIATASDTDDSENEEDKCCVCNCFTPKDVKEMRSYSVVFTKWVKCDNCTHWVHLGYCSKVRVIRRGEEFLCPHCEH